MTRYHDDELEPMTTLADGTTAYTCVVDRVRALLAAGHTITVTGHDSITITPAIDSDTTEWLARVAWQVSAIVADTQRTVQ